MIIDPRHLEQLAAIVDFGTLQEAANKIGTSQPALSRMIRTLESRIGMPLFERSSRPLVPTEIGYELADQGRSIKIARIRAAEIVDFGTRGTFGVLKIGAPPFTCERFAGEAISSFFLNRPEIRIDLIPDYFLGLQERLILNQIDIIICPINLAGLTRTELDIEPLFDDKNVIVGRSGHPLVKQKNIAPQDLKSVTWIGHSERSVLRSDMETALAKIGVTNLRFAFQSESAGAVLEMLRTTDFLSILPRFVVSESQLKSGLAILPVDLSAASRTVGMITHKKRLESPLVRAFKMHLRNSVGNWKKDPV